MGHYFLGIQLHHYARFKSDLVPLDIDATHNHRIEGKKDGGTEKREKERQEDEAYSITNIHRREGGTLSNASQKLVKSARFLKKLL